MTKRINKDCILFLGEASNGVTGSEYLISFQNWKILLECGLYQSSKNSYLDAYRINSAKFKFDPKEIDVVFVGHPHIDHCGLLPKLVKEGFRGVIITTYTTAKLMKPLLLNSYYILAEEAKILSKRYGREYPPIYDEEDVYKTLDLIQAYGEYNTLFEIGNGLKFQFLKNSHCLGAAQIQIILSNGLKTKKILYTSDLGDIKSKNHFVGETEIPDFFNDVVIMESTYADKERSKPSKREKDLEDIFNIVSKSISKNGSVVFPAFSFARTQELLVILFELFGNDPSFKTPVIVDSMLSTEISKLYSNLLVGSEKDFWKQVLNWKNLKLIKDKETSLENLSKNEAQIIISSSGFCTNGRIVDYLTKYLPDENSVICFCGYIGDNSSYISYRIKNAQDHKTITINHKKVKNKAKTHSLTSMSNHISHDGLIQYGTSVKTNHLILVHGEKEHQKLLKNELEIALSKKNKSFKVTVSSKGMSVAL